MFSHQFVNSIGNDLYNGFWYRDACWHLHFHRSYEFVWVTAGTLQATVADKVYLLHKGDGLFILPYQLHSYTTVENCDFFVAVFAAGYIGKFASATSGREPTDACFRLSPALQGYLRDTMAIRPADTDHRSVRQPNPPLFTLKACLYAVCSEFDAVATWQKKEQNNALIFRIITYVEENYTEDITLHTLADALSYEYHYLSRVLRENLHVRFRTLVNQYRCERAKELITETDLPLSEIALSCGFQNIRSFNRAFLEITGSTPTGARVGGSS
ncbi:MAG: helix-turn-helix transcriptional regulator [Clostridia bacterium]|nr:helix-turn-helix transcriptional regulator [Clostridia bacterium]